MEDSQDSEPIACNNLEHQPGTSAASSSRRQPGPMHVTQSPSPSCLIPSLNVDRRALGLSPALAEKFISKIAKTIQPTNPANNYPQYGFFPSAPRVTKYQGGAASRKGKKRALEELFKPPIDIIFKGDLQTARDSAISAKKWLLVNIQDAGEFQCQVLNRDVWSNEAVKTILREHFIFWQVSTKNIF